MSRIYGYEKGIALDIEDRTKPDVGFSTSQIPPQYIKQAEELYLEEIRAGRMILLQQNEKCGWIYPSKVIFGSSPKGKEQKSEIITNFQKVN